MTFQQKLLIGLFEWDGSIDPCIIIGTDEGAIYRAAVEACTYVTPSGERLPSWVTDEDDEDDEDADADEDDERVFLQEHPVPDLDDADACRAWMSALSEDDDCRSATEFNIWTDYRDVRTTELTPTQRGEAFSESEAYAAGRMAHAVITGQEFERVQEEIVHDALMAAFQAGYLAAREGTSVDELLRRMA